VTHDLRSPRVLAVLVLLTALALATRLPYLDADAARFKAMDELFDEGYWAHNARAAVLFGTPYPDDLAQAPASAPLYHWITEAIFRAAGVGFTQLRVSSAIASSLLVGAVWVLVAAEAGRRAALGAALLVLLSHELFAFGRLGMPEALQLLLVIAGAGVWIHRRNTRWAAGAGLLFAAALLAKLNPVLVFGFAGVWILERRQRRLGRRDVAAFAVCFIVPLAVWAVAWYLPHRALFDLTNRALNRDRAALALGDLGRLPLHFLSAPFWGLPGSLALGVLAALALTRLRSPLTRLETLAVGWLAGALIPMAFLVRSVGERRVLIVPVLLAILVAVDRGAGQAVTSDRAAPSRGLAIAAALASVLTIVATVFIAGHGARLLSPWGLGVIAGAGAIAIACDRGRAWLGARALTALLVAALATLPALAFGRFCAWLATGRDTGAPALAVTAAAAALALAVLVLVGRGDGPRRAVLAAYGAYGVVAIGINLVAPTFSVRDASRAIGTTAPDGGVIVGALAHTLSLENRTQPVWYTPRRARNNLLNADLGRFDVRFVLTSTPPIRFFFADVDDYPYALFPVGRFAIAPAPRLAGGAPPPKTTLTLYRVKKPD
jgi:4-amino-4-deoxy-L-arabinose transferase-like glycosyltransferase